MGKRRNPILVLVFNIITLGIYGLFWYYRTNREMLQLTQKDFGVKMWTLLLATGYVAFMAVYFPFSAQIQKDPNDVSMGLAIAVIVLALAYLGVAVMAYYKMADHVHRAHLSKGVPGMSVVPMFLLLILPLVNLVGIPLVQAQINKLW